MKAAVYHFTNRSHIRPKVNQTQLENLRRFAFSLGFDEVDIYCDEYVWSSRHSEFDRFMSCHNQYDALVLKDFDHFGDNTISCIRRMQDLLHDGIRIYTIDDGQFSDAGIPLQHPYRVATYYCSTCAQFKSTQIISVQNEILRLFVEKRTNWTLINQYADSTTRQKAKGSQSELSRLLSNRDQFDIVLVHNLNNIHWRVKEFSKYRRKLRLDIYSLQDGYLRFSAPADCSFRS